MDLKNGIESIPLILSVTLPSFEPPSYPPYSSLLRRSCFSFFLSFFPSFFLSFFPSFLLSFLDNLFIHLCGSFNNIYFYHGMACKKRASLHWNMRINSRGYIQHSIIPSTGIDLADVLCLVFVYMSYFIS